MSYFDSAYIAKFYVDEPESDAVRRLAETLARVHCCALGRIEVVGVFHRKWREGAFSEREFREVSAQFADDCTAGLWIWLSVTDRLVANALAIRSTSAYGISIARPTSLIAAFAAMVPKVSRTKQ